MIIDRPDVQVGNLVHMFTRVSGRASLLIVPLFGRRWESGQAAVFSPQRKLRQRERAALRSDAREFDYVRDEVATRLVERLNDITREFPDVLDVGAHTGTVLRALLAQGGANAPAPNGIRNVTMLDASQLALSSTAKELDEGARNAGITVHRSAVPIDGAVLPFADASFDLVFSSMAIHWINDIPKLFTEIRRVLKPDGAFLAAFLGGDTLDELKCVRDLNAAHYKK